MQGCLLALVPLVQIVKIKQLAAILLFSLTRKGYPTLSTSPCWPSLGRHCRHHFADELEHTALFWRQTYAQSHRTAALTSSRRRRRLIYVNSQTENALIPWLKAFGKELTGVFLDFERTYAKQWKHGTDIMHIDRNMYKWMNHDMFNEIFRYVPSYIFKECYANFNKTCIEAFAARK